MPDLKIFNKKEKQSFDNPPEFGSIERKKYFGLSNWALEKANSLRGATNKVCFIMLFGYFKAEKKFYSTKTFNPADIKYVAQRLNIPLEDVNIIKYKGASIGRHKKTILEYMDYKAFDNDVRKELELECLELVHRQIKPKLIFGELRNYLVNNKIEVPKYYVLSYIITKIIRNYEKDLEAIVKDNLTASNKISLRELIEVPEVYEKLGIRVNRHKLTLLKKLSQSIRPKKIEQSVNDFKELKSLFYEHIKVIEGLDLSPEVLKYYANSVLRGDVFNISRKKNELNKFLLLISFINHQLFRHHDTLIDVFQRSVKNNINFCNKEYKEMTYLERNNKDQKTQEIIKNLSNNSQDLKGIIIKIKEILRSDSFSSNDKIDMIASILSDTEKGKEELEELSALKDEVEASLGDNTYYEIMIASSRKFQNRVSSIVKAVEFNKYTSDKKLINAIDYYKEKDGDLKNDAPLEFLEDKEQDIVFDDNGKLKVSLYKVFLFRKMADGIKSGTLNLLHSYKYRSFDEYLIDKEDWKKNWANYIKRAGLQKFIDPEKVLNELAEMLDEGYNQTNLNILNKVNTYAWFDKNNVLRYKTPKVEKEITYPLRELFPDNKYIPLSEVISTVNKYTDFLNAFDHQKIKYHKKRPSEGAFIAGISSLGCNLSVGLMSKISKNIKGHVLENMINCYFTLDNVNEANNRILDFTSRLLLPNYLMKNKIIHTSSDGQKYNIKGESLNANYSYKYGGNRPAVSANTFIDNRHLLFHSTVFSSSEREAPYVIDGLYQNDVVKSDIHSTDTHGYSESIFGVTHLIDLYFAPRIANLKSQILYSFKKIKYYKDKGYKLLPTKYVKYDLIKKHWDDILRMIATIKLRKVTASQLFKRLSSYSKNHPLYRAIKAFGQIIKSIFILRYINDVNLRQAIQRQLNIGEHSNQFSKAVFYGNSQDFDYETREEQEIAEGCKRLIKNAIICWNYIYLSNLLATTISVKKRNEILAVIKNGMIQTWGHINMVGEFDYSDEKMKDSVGFNLTKILGLELE